MSNTVAVPDEVTMSEDHEPTDILGATGDASSSAESVTDGSAEGLFFPLMSWVYETLEEATEIAKSGMSKKEGLVLLILYRHRRDGVKSGADLEAIYRSWNHARHSERALGDLLYAVSKLLNDKRIETAGLPPAIEPGTIELNKDSLLALHKIELTKDGWFRVGAMRAVIELRLKDVEAKFGRSHREFVGVVREFELPPE
jgi:hypothetical protein